MWVWMSTAAFPPPRPYCRYNSVDNWKSTIILACIFGADLTSTLSRCSGGGGGGLPPRAPGGAHARGSRGEGREATIGPQGFVWTYRGRSLEKDWRVPVKFFKSGPGKYKRIVGRVAPGRRGGGRRVEARPGTIPGAIRRGRKWAEQARVFAHTCGARAGP
jgi:hypothetical protein